MKKIIYIALFAFVTSLTISSCTKEEVKPANVLGDNGGGSGSGDPIKD